MKFRYFFLLALLTFGLIQNSFCQYLQFVENKGQWNNKVNFKAQINGGSLFLQPQGYKVLLHNSNDLKEIADYFGGHSNKDSSKRISKEPTVLKPLLLHSHAYEVTFVGAANNAKPQPDKPLNTYNNYFIGEDSTKWASNCRIYSAVNYKNIYPDVDVRYYADNGDLKYDIIVKPGADVSKIALRFDGADNLSVNKYGNLVIKTSLGEAYELKPFSYQLNDKGRSKVDAKFEVSNNIVKFKLGNYSKTSTLVIDPALIFSSFTGSLADNWGYTATYDNQGNFYAGGIVFSDGYPTSIGAYDELFNGGDNSESTDIGYDVAIMKLSSNGAERLYATYLGGRGSEQPHSLIVDVSGNLVISGRTSSTDFPTTVANLGTCGSLDIFLSKLNVDGTQLLASRKFGGSNQDGVNIAPKYSGSARGAVSIRRNYGDDARSEVITDNSNNIYLASCTQSSNFPTTGNAFQKGLSGRQDGVLIKTSADLNTVYTCSYLGGNGDDAAFVLSLNPQNSNIYLAGGTTSTDFAKNANSASSIINQNLQGGVCDGFISIVSNDGSALIKSVYAGTSGNDLIYGIQFDKRGFPYIMGTTTVSFPLVGNPGFNIQSSGKQFITKLQSDLSSVVYSTNFGKGMAAPDISPTAFLVDVCENVYISGWGGTVDILDDYPNEGTDGLSITSNAIQRTTDGSDFYFFVLEKNAASQLYGSFFGTYGATDPGIFGDHVDGGTSRFDKRGVIYQAMCANCFTHGRFPTTPGVWSQENPSIYGSQCNEAAVKIAFELSGVLSSIRSSINGTINDSVGCIPLTVIFTDTVGIGNSFIWDFGDTSSPETTSVPTISHTYNAVGDYRVMLVAIDSSTCNIADTSYITIKARSNEALLSFNLSKLLPCDSLNYQFNNTSVPPAGLPFGASAFTWNFGDGTTLVSSAPSVFHTYASAGTYNVKLSLYDTAYCNAPDSVVVQLRASVILIAQFETPPIGCAPYNAQFTNTSLGGQSFLWNFGDGATSAESDPQHQYTDTGTYLVTLTVTDTSSCIKQDDTTFTIIVSASPVASFQFGPLPPKENVASEFINFSSGAVKYKWNFGDGDTLITISRDTPVIHIYNTTGTYKACLTAYSEAGCIDDTCQEISAIVLPLLDVPNAFTPNGDNVNDVVRVRGFGIDKLVWRIYNRWGILVFQTNNISEAWDGKYKGALQPMDVYAYVLDVTFTDRTQYSKKGDVTLIR